ncbi:MAG TPA: hypothetical protein VHH73_14135 [Verrucomicrobiae bacterium]|nr:hypothetical protein [Verrucomicrobiae bacterium]
MTALLRSRDPIHGQGLIYLDSDSSDVVWIFPNMLRAKDKDGDMSRRPQTHLAMIAWGAGITIAKPLRPMIAGHPPRHVRTSAATVGCILA